MNYKKLDYVMDRNGFISMIIYNTHPRDCIFISPKYFPCEDGGSWTSNETGGTYERFEYYWNLKSRKEGEGTGKVYEVDKNPLHQYKENVPELFDLEPVHDDCHGVAMYCIPKDRVARYYDAAEMYKKTVENPPEQLSSYAYLLDMIQGTFSTSEIGITGSYLYGLYQDFSDLNLVVYGPSSIERFYHMLKEHGGLLEQQEVSLALPGTGWKGWVVEPSRLASALNRELDAGTSDHPFTFKDRFIGSIHDPSNSDMRLGFWLANTNDVLAYGTFKKKVIGVAMIHAKIKDWASGMSSGNFALDDTGIMGFSSDIDIENHDKPLNEDIIPERPIVSMQIVSEFGRMFIFNEEIIAFGLLQEITIFNDSTSYYELLIGGREFGGWILPLNNP